MRLRTLAIYIINEMKIFLNFLGIGRQVQINVIRKKTNVQASNKSLKRFDEQYQESTSYVFYLTSVRNDMRTNWHHITNTFWFAYLLFQIVLCV